MNAFDKLTDEEIVRALLEKDPAVTRWFYYKKCRPLFMAVMKIKFDYPVQYDEFVDEVSLFLMENDARRLRQYNFDSTICGWLRTCLLRHFGRNGKIMIEDRSKEPQYEIEEGNYIGAEHFDAVDRINARIDIDILLDRLATHNERYAYVLRRILIDDAEYEAVAAEIGVTTGNLYNIKRRAYRELTEIALGYL